MNPTRNWIAVAAAGLLLSGCNTLTPKPGAGGEVVGTPSPHASAVQDWHERNRVDTVLSRTAEAPEDLWELSREHFMLDLTQSNGRIEKQVKYYSKHQDYLDRVTDRAERYYQYVLEQIIERDMPAELALLPIVESAYDPFAYSHAHASGPWQFIPGTARHFGLRTSWWYDGRRDIVASTDAALTYLEQLNKRFDGDWLLALAAYNAGGGTVSKAIKRNRKKGKPTDYWSLDLPRETEAYVPKLLALAKLVEKPEQHGISLKPLSLEPYFAIIDIDGQIDLKQAAKLAGTDIDEIKMLNPGFSRWATDPEGPHRLLIPVESAESFRTQLAALPASERVRWNHYRIKRGDTLSVIAARFNTTSDALRRANKLKGNTIVAGRTLLIPQGEGAVLADAGNATGNQRKLAYRVRSGDSFWKIARLHGVDVKELARWNKMAPRDPLKIGQQLTLYVGGVESSDS
ncbi:lytic transglycosylase [Marinobacterium nitratireducens]|uniref:Lytic transglycosylase n=1 Tax=Marinobacterium nitratireducens TaxID=518897 RepID=A0A918DR02_9GAMM|nr:LysM peptidoglycan-binding domain-containing protein [Marinobacterium nitratireducens]GGO80592.1 lytic transglycosylase [Marinobacterium nitratireducens]